MSESADEIVKRMQLVRRDVGDDVKGIVETAKTLTDWRYHVKHHPWICAGAVAALGFLIIPRKKKPTAAMPAEDAKELIALLKKYNVGVTAPPPNKGLAATLVGLAAPLVMRTVINAAQQHFSAAAQGSAFQKNPGEPEESVGEDLHVPR